jgi:hypothetical protein
MAALLPVGGPIPPVPVTDPPGPVLVPMDRAAAIIHFLTVCGLANAQRNVVMNVEGIQDLEALTNICLGDVKQMTENL